MKLLGVKSGKVSGCFQLKYFALLMMLIPYSLSQDNFPRFNVACDSTGFYVKIAFSEPFTGVVYAKGYKFDPLCSMTKSSALNGSLTLPLTACGTYFEKADYPWITNTVVIQYHPLVKTAKDVEKSLICALQSSESLWYSPLLLDQIYESHSLPLTDFSLNKDSGSDAFHEDGAKTFDNTLSRLTIFQLPNGTIFKDVGIKSCIVHDEGVLDENASFHQITSNEGCFSVNSKYSPILKVIETEEGLQAYVDLETFGIGSSYNIYLTCEVIFCKTKCICSQNQQMKHPTSVISHKLTKRSTDASSEIFSVKQYEERTRYLKSTVKALMDRILEQRKRNGIKSSKVRRGLMRSDDSPFLSEINSQVSIFPSTDAIFPKPVSTDLFNLQTPSIEVHHDFEPDALMDRISEQRKQSNTKLPKVRRRLISGDSPSPSETNSQVSILPSTDGFFPKPVSTNIFNKEAHLVDVHHDFEHEDSHLDHLDESPLAKEDEFEEDSRVDYLDEHPLLTEDDFEHEDSHVGHLEEHSLATGDDFEHEDSHIDHFNEHSLGTEDSPKYWEKPSPTSEVKKFKDNGFKTSSGEELLRKDTTVVTNDVALPVKESSESPKIVTTTDISLPSEDEISDHAGNCVSRIRFIIVIVAMGFFIGCLLMVSCGLVLYIRKEKRRNRLNDFLLYSIGF